MDRGVARWSSFVAVALLACSGPADLDDAGLDGSASVDAARECSRDSECDDGVGCTVDRCSERGECTHEAPDADSDGAGDATCLAADGRPLGRDCDDADANRFPGNPEVCDIDGHDEDCDPSTYGAVDLDADGHDDARCCNVGPDGAGSICGDDCDDADPTVSPSAVETCDGVDDDCDGLVDDVTDGVVACAAGETRPCTTSCGLMGTQTCGDGCLGFDACAAPEVCNYCDDDGDGELADEVPLATATSMVELSSCAGGDYSLRGTATALDCSASEGALSALLLDGSVTRQAGALWYTPSDLTQGWGTTTLVAEVEAEVLPGAGTDAETAVGGWAVVLARGATPAVGFVRQFGIPNGLTGIGARYSWARYTTCGPNVPPTVGDGSRGIRMVGFGVEDLLVGGVPSCDSTDPIGGASTDLDGPGSRVRQRMEIRYTPDDPTTATTDEERFELLTSTPTDGGSVSRTYFITDGVPPGSGPLHVGITAGNYEDSGFVGPPAGWTIGARVRVRVSLGAARQTLEREDVCP